MVDLFKKGFNYLVTYPVFLVPPLIPAIVSILVSVIILASALSALHGGKGVFAALVLFVIGITITLVVQLVVSAMLIHMAQRAEEGAPPTLGESYRISMERLGDIVVASCIVSIAVGIGLLFFIIPGIVLAFFFIFTFQEIIVGGKGAFEAITGSYELVKETFSNTLGFFILLLIIALIVGGILGLIPMVGNFVATLIITPYCAIVTTLYYLQVTRGSRPQSSTIIVEG